MLHGAVTPPGLWVTLAVILAVSALVYWKRRPIKDWLRRVRVKKVSVGPVTLELEPGSESPPPLSPPPRAEEKSPLLATVPSRTRSAPFSVSVPPTNVVFQQLLYFARREQCRLFIGSGVSFEAGMPDAGTLRDVLRAELIEMGSPVPAGATLPEVATALEKAAGRAYMVEVLQHIFDDALRSRPWQRGAYAYIPRLPSALTAVIYTSNWDDLLRRAFEETGQAAREICSPNELPLIPQAEHAIVKVHRDFQNIDGPIASEADYAIALHDIEQGTAGTLWGHLAGELVQYRFVFAGYGLGDPTLNLIRQAVELRTRTAGEQRHFMVGPLSAEEARAAERWAGVLPVVSGASDFFQALAQAL